MNWTTFEIELPKIGENIELAPKGESRAYRRMGELLELEIETRVRHSKRGVNFGTLIKVYGPKEVCSVCLTDQWRISE